MKNYRLVLTGELTPGMTRQQAILNLCKMMDIPPERANQMVALTPKVMKSNISKKEGEHFMELFAKAGFVTLVEENPDQKLADFSADMSAASIAQYKKEVKRDFWHCPVCGVMLREKTDHCPNCNAALTAASRSRQRQIGRYKRPALCSLEYDGRLGRIWGLIYFCGMVASVAVLLSVWRVLLAPFFNASLTKSLRQLEISELLVLPLNSPELVLFLLLFLLLWARILILRWHDMGWDSFWLYVPSLTVMFFLGISLTFILLFFVSILVPGEARQNEFGGVPSRPDLNTFMCLVLSSLCGFPALIYLYMVTAEAGLWKNLASMNVMSYFIIH